MIIIRYLDFKVTMVFKSLYQLLGMPSKLYDDLTFKLASVSVSTGTNMMVNNPKDGLFIQSEN